MAQIFLHGDLAQFGGPFALDVASPAEAVRALCSQVKGFRRRLTEGCFRIVRRRVDIERDLSLDRMETRLQHHHELHFIPELAGSAKGSTKAILGVAIIASAFTFGAGAFLAAGDLALTSTALSSTAFSVAGFGVSFAQIAGFGAMMVIGGISQLLSPSPPSTALGAQAANPGGLFSGPANVVEQGGAKPMVFGRFICGSVCISSALDAESVPVGSIA